MNPRTDRIETVEEVRESIERALEIFPAERIFLNPDCGFGTFSRRPVNTTEGAAAKLRALVAAARAVRSGLLA